MPLQLIKLGQNYWVTCLLILLNLIIFFYYGLFATNTLELLQLGGNFAPYALSDEPGRLVSSMFLHGGVIHLIANMYGLFYVGTQLEKNIGPINLLVLYLLTGLLAGIASINFNLFIVSVGASGAIFGIYGFLIVDTIRKNPTNKASIITNFIFYLLFMTIIGSKLNFDNAAHLGGALSGILIGLLYKKVSPAYLFSFVFGITIIIYLVSPRYQVAYFNAYQKHIDADSRLNGIFNESLNDKDFYDSLSRVSDLPDNVKSHFLSIEYLPNRLTKDTTLIFRYLDLQSKQIEYFLTGLSKESFIYLDSIGLIQNSIRALPEVKYNLNFNVADTNNKDSLDQPAIKRQYYDSNWFETDSYNFKYFRYGQVDTLGNWHGRVEDYYKDGTIQMKGAYTRGLRDGIFIYYTQDSTYESAGRYSQDNPVGKWETYHANRQLHTEIRHIDGFSRIQNLWDSSGHQMVTDGMGEEVYTYPNGSVKFKRTIVEGLNHGFIESYYEDGSLRYKEYYENGKLIKGISYFDNSENIYDASVYFPYPSGGYDAFYNYLSKENGLSSESVDGEVTIRFSVHETSKIFDIRVLKSFKPKYDNYAKKLLLDGPPWIPARSHGLFEITSTAEITVRF